MLYGIVYTRNPYFFSYTFSKLKIKLDPTKIEKNKKSTHSTVSLFFPNAINLDYYSVKEQGRTYV